MFLNPLKSAYLLISIMLLSGCAVHRFPVVRPVQEFPREINTKVKAQEYFIRARDYERRGLDQSAERYYEMAYELDPTSQILQEQVARKYIEGGKYSQALVLLKKGRKNAELDRNSKRMVSTVYLKMGEFAKAAEVLESIEERSPEEMYSLGLIYESLGMVDKALQNYLDYYAKESGSVQMGAKIGNLLISEKRFEEAESLYISIKEREGETPEILTMLGNVQVVRGDTGTGLKYYQSALEIDCLYGEALRNMAQVFLSGGNYPGAIICYERLFNNSQFGEIYGRTLGFLYYLDKKYDKAEKLLTELLQEAIDDYELHYYLGLVFAAHEESDSTQAQKFDMAQMEFEKVLTIKNTFEDAWRDLCYLFIRKKEYERALSVAERYVAALPQSASSWRVKGIVFNLQKEYSSAIEALKYSIARDSSNAYAWFELGSALERTKQFEPAADAFRRVLKLRPEDPAASNYLGYMWADLGINLDSAKLLIESALKHEPENGAFLDSYAWVYFRNGEIDSAYYYLQKAMKIINDDPVLFSHLGDVLVKKENLTEAVEAYRESERLYRKSSDPDSSELEEVRRKISDLQILIQRNGD